MDLDPPEVDVRLFILASALAVFTAPAPARAYDLSCAEKGLEYSYVTQKCEPPERKVTIGAKDVVRLWREAVSQNEDTFTRLDGKGCDLRGPKHREPSIDGVKSLDVLFVDGTVRRIIPTDINCEGDTSDREASGTTCEITHYENKKGNDDYAYDVRKLKMNTSRTNTVIWSGPSGEHPIVAVKFGSVNEASKYIRELASEGDGPGCKLARSVRKNRSSSPGK